ncbi:hypothetical protein ThvES_00021150, partial [Thiovulum sp. ES]
ANYDYKDIDLDHAGTPKGLAVLNNKLYVIDQIGLSEMNSSEEFVSISDNTFGSSPGELIKAIDDKIYFHADTQKIKAFNPADGSVSEIASSSAYSVKGMAKGGSGYHNILYHTSGKDIIKFDFESKFGVNLTSFETDPYDIEIDENNNIYVSLPDEHRIVKISPSGEVQNFVGSGIAGYQDGVGFNSQLNKPRGMTFDEKGNLLVVDSYNEMIREISPDGKISTKLITNLSYLYDVATLN